jgi:hypothetical protein
LTRIYLGLALLAVGLLAANIVVGWMIGDYNGAFRELHLAIRRSDELKARGAPRAEIEAATRRIEAAGRDLKPFVERKVTHFLLGLVATLVTLLVNSITVTYFIGTSRWCLEVVETYELDPSLARNSSRLKRQAFPWALIGILTVMAIASIGALSDPQGPFRTGAAVWVTPHLMAAILGTGLIGWALLVQLGKIAANYEIIEQIVADVRRIRAERGLDE